MQQIATEDVAVEKKMEIMYFLWIAYIKLQNTPSQASNPKAIM